MGLFRRAPQLPPEHRHRLVLTDDDVLAAVEMADHRWAVATRRALHVVDDTEVSRWPWSQVDQGRLDPVEHTLTVHIVDGGEVVLALLDKTTSRPFAATFRERVQQSIVCSCDVSVPHGVVYVTIRRAEDDTLFSQVVNPGAVDLHDPEVAALVQSAEARVREAAGMS
ncbi:MAG: hypothetical protein FWF02_06930 [Micrococcales bacterium]|nr:hypothetical protein [Micrococcales bacterium]MCL2667426.1 hypothetical protein [Micrococcales bacterium]